ncbi:hypothetical protein M3Y97_00166300 [Aphelenchoides bicaudatus]|nr:hypothetical protein M3Y97_00166300 [Aphelenchoides bicaudatus]
MPPTEEICKQAEAYNNDPWLCAMNFAHLLFSLFSVVVVLRIVWFIKKSGKTKIFNCNLKTLLLVGAFLIIVNSTISFGFYAYLLVIKFLKLSPCFYVWTGIQCFLIRSTQHYSTVCFTILHLAIFFERLYAIKKQDDSLDAMGKLLVTLVFVVPAVLIGYMYYYEIVFNEYRPYCIASSLISSNRILGVTWLMAVIDVCTAIGDVIIRKYCQKMLKGNRCQLTLHDAFRFRELETSVLIILPLTILHTLCFLPWPILVTLGRPQPGLQLVHFIEGAILVKAVYSSFLPLSYFYFHQLRCRKVAQDEWNWSTSLQGTIHFQQLRKQLGYF